MGLFILQHKRSQLQHKRLKLPIVSTITKYIAVKHINLHINSVGREAQVENFPTRSIIRPESVSPNPKVADIFPTDCCSRESQLNSFRGWLIRQSGSQSRRSSRVGRADSSFILKRNQNWYWEEINKTSPRTRTIFGKKWKLYMPERAICKNKGNHAKMSQKMMATYSERRELKQNVQNS